MSYKYHIFLSYKRGDLHGKWVDEVFYPRFLIHLGEALGQGQDMHKFVFKDTESIKTGQEWKDRIRDGLVHSQIMIPVLSTAYFKSEWCMKEYATFRHRYDSNVAKRLILPLSIFDGRDFPAHAQDLQIRDFTKYNREGLPNLGSPLFLEFQDQLEAFCKDVAEAVKSAPAFDPIWASNDWVEDVHHKYPHVIGNIHLNPPLL